MTEADSAPLAGVRIVDFTQFLAGPYATMILGDLGAEVIKVETPAGELARHLPPHFVGDDSVYYLAVNRNKRSLAVDLKSESGRAIVQDLVARADVVVENFRPGVMARLGLDPERLLEAHPRLVVCSVSGFGQDGPSRDLPAYDMIIQALSGGMSLTGEVGGRPVRAGIPLADEAAGLFAVIGVLSALAGRARTGRGRRVDISMLDCQVSMLSYQAAYSLHSGVTPGLQGRGHDSIPTYRAFTAGDDEDIVVTANTEDMWTRLCGALGLPDLASQPDYATNIQRHAHRDRLEPLLEDLFRAAPAAEWVRRLRDADVPVGQVNSVEAALADPQVRHRNMVLELVGADGRRVAVPGNPIKFGADPEPAHRFPPPLGADTEQILRDVLEIAPERIAALLEEKVILAATPA